ncbi:amino acid permease 6-like [Telopea speciosissima]|uniref:amino acid permease 6-like n=1 Tax=Telopea speciosissima TaxID=54955 RepID=UPI001CC4FB0E|nr:amino acid permease 6-like [Telopea speciosissima]
MSTIEEDYKPPVEFQVDAKDPLVDISLTDSTELWLIQWPINQPPDFDGEEVSLKLHNDGHLGSFESSSGKSYKLVSFAAQEPDATVFLSSPSESKAVGKISRRVSLVHYPEPTELEKPISNHPSRLSQRSGTSTYTSHPMATPTHSKKEREMALELQKRNGMFMEHHAPEVMEKGFSGKSNLDDDGREKRTGTMVTASAHIITAVIGSGVLSLAWAIAQLGWVAGPAALLAFSVITWFTSTLLADCYRFPDPISGQRSYTYMDVVRSNLGGMKFKLCGLAQYANLIGTTIGYTITASISMVAIQRSNCFHQNGHQAPCYTSNYPFMVIFASIQIVLSQIPNFHKLSWLSIVAAIMSFAYSSIGVGLSIAKVAEKGHHMRTTLTGVTVGVDVSGTEKVWRTFQALGNIAFAYSYSMVLIEIQDTLKSSPPENKVMKKASLVGVLTTTLFYMLCGCMGYAAFGNDAPGNFLTGFGFYEPFWLIDFANICIAIHLIGAYQVFCQPIFGFVENRCNQRWPENGFLTNEYAVNIPFYGSYYINFFRLIWRTAYVILTSVLAMILPFFNDFIGLMGAASFYPLTVYFPIEMHIAQAKLQKYSLRWTWLKILSWACLIVSILAFAGSVQGLVADVKTYKPFKIKN